MNNYKASLLNMIVTGRAYRQVSVFFVCACLLNVEVKVEVPHSFAFPFRPYDIQLDLMRKLYEALELGKIGIFESPTGTVCVMYLNTCMLLLADILSNVKLRH